MKIFLPHRPAFESSYMVQSLSVASEVLCLLQTIVFMLEADAKVHKILSELR